MIKFFKNLRRSLISQFIIVVGSTLLIGLLAWSHFNIQFQQDKLMGHIIGNADRLTSTIKLGTHYAMMLNSRDDINQIITNIGKQKEITNVRIYNKEGHIKFSNNAIEIDQQTNIKSEACDVCHRSDPPKVNISLDERTRLLVSDEGIRHLGIISPIFNEPGCAASNCHFHPADKQILGALDVVVSLADTDHEMQIFESELRGLTLLLFLSISAVIFIFVVKFINLPIRRLIDGTRKISKGDYTSNIEVKQKNEIGKLAEAMNRLMIEIDQKQTELNLQRDEYQNLFELVPCIITVQDRNYKLIQYNREFSQRFDPKPGDHCYYAYKGRKTKCVVCPVEKTFADGKSYYSEETGISKDGKPTHWIVKTSPVRNDAGEIIAAMEMSLDITFRKELQEKLRKTEKKYYDIFNHIPNPVFVIDKDSFKIIDCNQSVKAVYGYTKQEILNTSFLDLFDEEGKDQYSIKLRTSSFISKAAHKHKKGDQLFVDIRLSPHDYQEKQVLLVTTSDITKRLETEQQLSHASKMATLGEMATGVAHELNQPLTVIKTASSILNKKFEKLDISGKDMLSKVSQKISNNIDRASKIINHMREFARKSETSFEPVQINNVIDKTFDMFSQQFKVRGIQVEWQLQPTLPPVMADPDRLEQVFANLFINARHAIEERWQLITSTEANRKIKIETLNQNGSVLIKVSDTGTGIPDHIAEKIFEPFFTTKEVGKGTGLGLSISYGIIKDTGGDIWVQPNADGGATFMIKLPIQGKTP
jgi:histidine kinase